MKKALFLIPLVAVLAALAIFWWSVNSKSLDPQGTERDFLILKGSSASQIANKLENEGVIRSPLAFRFYVQLTSQAKSIQAGEYLLSPASSLFEIVTTLTGGPKEVWVTIPEGFRREEIADRFVAGLEKEGDEAASFRSEFLFLTQELEGRLFPDTYLFPKTAEASLVVNALKSTFDKRIAEIQDDIDVSSLSLDEIVILASIIERETVTSNERPVVSGVLMNRLDIGMGLQVDATVQYVAGGARCQGEADCEWWRPPTATDLSIDSSYNTYRYRGLPPAPIANPGLASLSAAANPEETDYFYYLHDSSGQIHFSETLEGHNANKSRYLN